MKDSNSSRAAHEIEHGRKLVQREPELIWGWGTAAGRLRASRRADLIINGAALDPGKRALEIGCGTGLFTEKFVRTGAQIIAVDISPDLLEKARARGLPESQVRFLAKPFEQCDVEGPFDAVIGSSVLASPGHQAGVGQDLRAAETGWCDVLRRAEHAQPADHGPEKHPVDPEDDSGSSRAKELSSDGAAPALVETWVSRRW